MVLKALFHSFAACWAIVCGPMVVLRHPGVMPVLACCGMVTSVPSALLAEWFRWSVCWVIVLSGHSRVLCFGIPAGAG